MSHPHANASDGPGGARASSGHPAGRDYDETPLIVTWEATQACALACDHCRADAQEQRDPAELTTSEVEDLLDQVVDFGTPGPIFVISGGDPLERPDLFEIIDASVERGIPTAVTPATTPDLDRATVRELADRGVRRMAVSLDGASARSHDEFRGEEGTFDRAMKAAAYAEEVGLSIQVNTTVTAETVSRLPEIANLVEYLGAAAWEVFFLVPIGRGIELAQISPERAREVMAWLHDRQDDAPFRLITVEAPFYRRVAMEAAEDQSGRQPGTTGAGKGFVFVSHTGEVFPSGFMPEAAGNVRAESLVDIYREGDLMGDLRNPDAFTGPCGTCEYRAVCGGSRSRAYAATGNPQGSDPLCPWVANAD